VPSRYAFASQTQTILVAYSSSSYGAGQSFVPGSALRTPEFALVFLLRSLRGPFGVHAALDGARRALMGWRCPQGGTPLMPLRDQFVSESQGVWRFSMNFSLTIPVVAEPDPEPEAPLLTAAEVDSYLDPTLIRDAS
jgi:hypothetical protein